MEFHCQLALLLHSEKPNLAEGKNKYEASKTSLVKPHQLFLG